MINFSTQKKNDFGNPIRVSNSLDLDQVCSYVGPDQSLNCLQRLSADKKSLLARKDLNMHTQLNSGTRDLFFGCEHSSTYILYCKSGNFRENLVTSCALDKLLGQLGIYATWLSSIAYLQKQLRIFIFFLRHIFFL